MPHLTLLRSQRAPPEDDEIKHLSKSDRRMAMDLVARKYGDRLFNHACYVVKDYQEAVDVIQEVFIKAMRERRFFDDEFKMKAWLFRVTSNLCFNIVRDRRRRGGILDAMPKKKATEADQDTRVAADERQATVLAALDELGEKHKEILMLRYYSDLSYAEIAEALQIKLGTVMSRLSRAKVSLSHVLCDTGMAHI